MRPRLSGSPVLTTHVLYTDIVYAVVDETPMHAWCECRPANNKSPPGSARCGID